MFLVVDKSSTCIFFIIYEVGINGSLLSSLIMAKKRNYSFHIYNLECLYHVQSVTKKVFKVKVKEKRV